tara:strand:- start:275 stop:514 length:240 start_codon:yes stop_codon:yes gene_type:complete
MRKTDIEVGLIRITITKEQIDKLLNNGVLSLDSHLYKLTTSEDKDYVEGDESYTQTEKEFISVSIIMEGVLDEVFDESK